MSKREVWWGATLRARERNRIYKEEQDKIYQYEHHSFEGIESRIKRDLMDSHDIPLYYIIQLLKKQTGLSKDEILKNPDLIMLKRVELKAKRIGKFKTI